MATNDPRAKTPRTDALVLEFHFPWSSEMEMLVRHAETLRAPLGLVCGARGLRRGPGLEVPCRSRAHGASSHQRPAGAGR